MTTVLKVVKRQEGLGVANVEGAVDLRARGCNIIEVRLRTDDGSRGQTPVEKVIILTWLREDITVIIDVGRVLVVEGRNFRDLPKYPSSS